MRINDPAARVWWFTEHPEILYQTPEGGIEGISENGAVVGIPLEGVEFPEIKFVT